MWLLDKKKGVSIMVGYVLLVTCAIIIGVVVYQWVKTYVPADALECPEGTSIFIKEYTYDCDNSELSLTLKNNGLFNTAGYFIHATNEEGQELATIDLSNYTLLGEGKGGTVLFSTGNSFKPNDEETNIFELSGSEIGQIYSIEIIPVRFQEEDGKNRFVSCGGSKVEEKISCWTGCADTCASLGYECGTHTICDIEIICPPNDCGSGYFCNSTGNCEEVPATCEEEPISCDAGECNSCPQDCNHADCCPDETCNNDETCGDTNDEPECNSDCGACEIVCGDGIIESPEECDDGDTENGDGCSSSCAVEGDWTCIEEPSICIPGGIISWWKLNDDSMEDTIGENDGTCTSCPEFINDDPERGEVASFDGNNDYITASVGTLNSPFSVSAWGYFNSLDQGNNNYDYISMIGTGDDMISISRHAAGDDVNKYYTYTEGGILTGPVLAGQQWLHIVVVWDDTSPYHSLYINGVSQTVSQSTAAINTNGEIILGEYITHSHQIDGKIDDVMIFNKSLSEDEIDALYNLELS